jgi:DNA repair exonuclease SbcCD ATPase subunit
MKIEQLVLENIGPYVKRKFEFLPAGLIGITGPNGAGKSTLLSAAYAALTNDFTRFDDVKAGAIRDTSSDQESAAIEAVFTHEAARFSVYRGLRPSAHRLRIGQQEAVTKDAEIKLELERLLRIPRMVLDTQVFVPQWEMFQFLLADPAERSRLFQYYCDTSRAEEIWSEAGKAQTQSAAGHTLVEDTREFKLDQQARGQAGLTEVEEQLAETELSILPDPTLQSLRETIAQRTRGLTAQAQLQATTEALRAAREELARHQQRVQELQAPATVHTATLQEVSEQIREADKEIQAWEAKLNAERACAAARQRLAEVPPAEVPPERVTDELTADQLLQQQSEWSQRLAAAQARVEQLEQSGVSECPTCGTAVANLDLTAEHETIALAPEIIADLQDRRKRLVQSEREFQTWSGRQIKRGALLAERERAVELAEQAAAKLVCRESQEHWHQRHEQLQLSEREARQFLDRVFQPATRAAEGAQSKVSVLEQQLQTAQAMVESLPLPTAQDAQLAESRLTEHSQAVGLQRGLAQQAQTLRELLATTAREIEAITAALARGQKVGAWLSRLDRIREVSHRDVWPRQVVQNYLYLLREDIDRVLDYFGPPFHCEMQEDLTISARIIDKQVVRPPRRLSGGYRMLLALAVRLAIHRRANLGLLCLDEPTAGVDRYNIGYLVDAFAGLTQLAKDQNLQILMVTHEERLLPVFDQVISL